MLIPLVCTSPRQCAGVLRLQRRAVPRAAAASTRSPTKTYGRVRFRIPAGKTKRIKVRLTKAGKRLLHKRRRARVFVNVDALV